MLKIYPLTAWIQKAGIGRKKKKKEKLSAELAKFYELLLVDKNPLLNNPLKERSLSHQQVWERVEPGSWLLAGAASSEGGELS